MVWHGNRCVNPGGDKSCVVGGVECDGEMIGCGSG